MRGRLMVWGGMWWLGMALGHIPTACAQVPVCPNPVRGDAYYTACAPAGRFGAARLLFDLGVDHLFKSDSAPLRRRAGDVLRSLVPAETLDKNVPFRAFLDDLAPITLAKLDTATGTVQLSIDDEQRRFDGKVELGDAPFPLTVQLPARLSGGYWRTPGVLQIAFWEGGRANVGLGAPGPAHVQADVECLVISTDGVRVVTSGPTPDILVKFEDCGP